MKGLLDQWYTDQAAAEQADGQAATRQAILSGAEEEALTRKLKDRSNYADGENGINDFAKDFVKLMNHLEAQKLELENMQ